MSREPEDLNDKKLGVDAACGLDTIHPGHRNIHDDNVRTKRPRLINYFEPIAGLAHNLKLGSEGKIKV